MKLLIYGGCHALILKRLILELSRPGAHHVDLIVNFELVRSGQPFPYDTISSYDAIIYSPIENKADYNTSYLEEACRAARVQSVCYPWLEWHGYAPSSDKDVFWGNTSWYFPDLVRIGSEFSNFDRFYDSVVLEFPSEDAISKYFQYSTEKLKDQENRAKCEVLISDFILDGFRDRRMFLIPDHPTLIVYRRVLEQIEKILGKALIDGWPRGLPEPQPEARTPILPKIASVLGLSFSDDSWRCATQPLQSMTLRSFLMLHYALGQMRRQGPADGGGMQLATSCRPTLISPFPGSGCDARPISAPIFTQMLLRRVGQADDQGHFAAEIVSALAGFPADDFPQDNLRFRTEDWICQV